MPVIDADTHVDETEDTWEFVDPDQATFKPVYHMSENFDPSKGPGRYWIFDGGIRQRRRVRSNEVTGTTQESRELLDVDARLRHMDELGTQIHVLYPTVFATEFTDRAELEWPVKKAYNRWLGERTGSSAEARERLRWVVVPPTLSMDKALDEMRWGKEHGACGVLKKGDLEAGHWPAEEYFYPFYEEAEELGLTICFHLGGGIPDTTPAAKFGHVGFMFNRAPLLNAFDSLVRYAIPQRFPGLRWAFVEAASGWVPYLTYMLERQLTMARDPVMGKALGGGMDYDISSKSTILRDNRFFVTCLVDEDLPYILQYVGEDNLMVGSDYSHSDFSQQGNFTANLYDQVSRGVLSDRIADKILWDNPKECYGL